MNAAGVLLTGGGPANDGAQRDERGLRGLGLGGLKSLIQSGGVLLVGSVLAEPVDALNVPAVGLVAGQDVLVEAMEVLSSIEMWLSSQMTVRLPSSWVPASEEASADTPSSKQPSPAMTYTLWSKTDSPSGVLGSSRPWTRRAFMAKPTAEAMPVPSGPVVISTPLVWPYSGWPGVRDPAVRSS